MNYNFSKNIDFNNDSTREFFFTRLSGEDSDNIVYVIATKEEGYLTNMLRRNNRWVFEEVQETPIFCLALEPDFAKLINEYESKYLEKQV